MPKLSPYTRGLPYSYAPGIFPSHALLDAMPGAARRLLVHSSAEGSEGVAALRRRCEALGIRAEVADQALSRVSRKENCFAALVFEKYERALFPNAPHIVLHQPSDMGNLGTILRSCLGFGIIDLAIVRPAADLFDPRVVRASMGALFAMRISHFDSFDAYRAANPRHSPYPFMVDGVIPLARAAAHPRMPYALIFGNEATGLPSGFAGIGQTVHIPHGPQIDSLNLSVAVSIAAYAFAVGRFGEGDT